jgi:hypothetical protein
VPDEAQESLITKDLFVSKFGCPIALGMDGSDVSSSTCLSVEAAVANVLAQLGGTDGPTERRFFSGWLG